MAKLGVDKKLTLQKRQETEACDARVRKVEALKKDINELKSKKAMLKKLQETLKSDSESLMLKAPEDATKAHAYAIEGKGIMCERKHKIEEVEKLTEAIICLEKKRKEF